VKDRELAAFVFNQNDGSYLVLIEGPFDGTLKTGNFPVLNGLAGSEYGGDTPFQTEIYFINLTRAIPFNARLPYLTYSIRFV
jgi:hypothetical protein